MTEKETVTALSNLRPQHLTDALMINPILDPAQSGLTYVLSEFYQEEPDNRPRAKSKSRIVRGYYHLEEITSSSAGQARLYAASGLTGTTEFDLREFSRLMSAAG